MSQIEVEEQVGVEAVKHVLEICPDCGLFYCTLHEQKFHREYHNSTSQEGKPQ